MLSILLENKITKPKKEGSLPNYTVSAQTLETYRWIGVNILSQVVFLRFYSWIRLTLFLCEVVRTLALKSLKECKSEVSNFKRTCKVSKSCLYPKFL